MTAIVGHTPGTVDAEARVSHGPARRTPERQSSVLPGWPQLMPLALAAKYIGISEWTLSEYVAEGSLPVVRPKRPHTAKAYRARSTNGRKPSRPAGDTMRKVLFHRDDLDALANQWRGTT
jgi:hypothetical protein